MELSENVRRGLVSIAQHAITGHDLILNDYNAWCWEISVADMDELHRQLDTHEDIKILPSIIEVVPCTEDELAAMEYVNR